MNIDFSGGGAEADVVAARAAEKVAMLDARRAERVAVKEARKAAARAGGEGPVEGGDDEGGGDDSTTPARPAVAIAIPAGVDAPPSVDAFWELFNAGVAGARSSMAAARSSGMASTDEAVKTAWEGWTAGATRLQRLLNASTLLLPPFDVRKAQLLLDGIVSEIAQAKAAIQPRRKFAFTRRPGGRDGAATAAATPATHAATVAAGLGDRVEKWAVDDYVISDAADAVLVTPLGHFTGSTAATTTAVDGDGGCTVLPSPGEPTIQVAKAKDVRLLNLRRCVVALLDVTRAIRVDNVHDCVILCGPTAGSVLLHDCARCVFWTASRQIRIHTSTDCTYHLHTTSRPIIEHCDRLTFAPYVLSYPGLPTAMVAAGLSSTGGSGGGGSWHQVDDFGWHRVQRSPHWAIMPALARPQPGPNALVRQCVEVTGMGVVAGGVHGGVAEKDASTMVSGQGLTVADPASCPWVVAAGEPAACEERVTGEAGDKGCDAWAAASIHHVTTVTEAATTPITHPAPIIPGTASSTAPPVVAPPASAQLGPTIHLATTATAPARAPPTPTPTASSAVPVPPTSDGCAPVPVRAPVVAPAKKPALPVAKPPVDDDNDDEL